MGTRSQRKKRGAGAAGGWKVGRRSSRSGAPGSGVMLGIQGTPLSSLGKVCNLGDPLLLPPASLLPSLFSPSCPFSPPFSPSPLRVSFPPYFPVFLSLPALNKTSPPPAFLFLKNLPSLCPSLSFSLFSRPPFFYSLSLPLIPPVPHPFILSVLSLGSICASLW